MCLVHSAAYSVSCTLQYICSHFVLYVHNHEPVLDVEILFISRVAIWPVFQNACSHVIMVIACILYSYSVSLELTQHAWKKNIINMVCIE